MRGLIFLRCVSLCQIQTRANQTAAFFLHEPAEGWCKCTHTHTHAHTLALFFSHPKNFRQFAYLWRLRMGIVTMYSFSGVWLTVTSISKHTFIVGLKYTQSAPLLSQHLSRKYAVINSQYFYFEYLSCLLYYL